MLKKLSIIREMKEKMKGRGRRKEGEIGEMQRKDIKTANMISKYKNKQQNTP